MFLSPRIPVEAVIRRQILEGVLAVTKLTRSSQDKSKIPLQVFDRTAGANNVRFDEYVDLEPRIAGELVLREKTKLAAAKAPPPQLTYAQPQYPPAQTYQTPPAAAPAAATPNLGNLVGQLDNATLQKLLGSLNSLPQQNTVAAAQNSQFDLAGVLSGLMKGQPQAPQQQQAYRQYQAQAQVPPAAAPNLASMLGGGGQQVPQNAQQVQDIMAQLARFRQ
jgi:nuclear polyadenylated RNA-binding protein 3